MWWIVRLMRLPNWWLCWHWTFNGFSHSNEKHPYLPLWRFVGTLMVFQHHIFHVCIICTYTWKVSTTIMAHLKMCDAQIKYGREWGGWRVVWINTLKRKSLSIEGGCAEMGLSSKRPLCAKAFLHKIKSQRMFYDIIYGGMRAPDLWSCAIIQVNQIITFRYQYKYWKKIMIEDCSPTFSAVYILFSSLLNIQFFILFFNQF